MAKKVQRWPFWILFGWFLLSVVYLKVYLHARSEFRVAEERLAKGEMLSAIRHYGLVVRWYTPGSRYVRVSLSKLFQIGEHAYRRGDWEQAIAAYQHLRSALLAIRGAVQPHQDALKKSQAQLALVMSHLPSLSGVAVVREKREQTISLQLERTAVPLGWFSVGAWIFYLLWLGGALAYCAYWPQMSHRWRITGALGALGCFVGWLLLLANA